MAEGVGMENQESGAAAGWCSRAVNQRHQEGTHSEM
jgi:hypothetical protein